MAEQVPAVCDVLDTIERQNWERLRQLFHPDVHWTTAVEEHLHGPSAVIACLSEDRRLRRRHTTSWRRGG
jgi:SnoaL-like domain